MKRLLFAAACILPYLASAQVAPAGFTIKGKIGTLSAPAKAYLSYRVESTVVSDSAELNNGTFAFSGKIPDYVSASIMVKHTVAAAGSKRTAPDVLSLYLENKVITISSADSIKNAVIKGSAVNDDFSAMKAFLKPVADKSAALNAEVMAIKPADRTEEVMKPFYEKDKAITAELNALYAKYAAEHTSSYIGLVAFRNSLGYSNIDDVTAQPMFDKYSAAVRSTTLGKTVASIITAAKFTKVGAMAMNFTQNDADGKPVSLSDFKGKYVLIDFWAAWCGPCRQENPNVVAAYNAYKDKNFTVLGISLDKPGTKDAWLKAVKDDGLNWTQVSDLQWWNNAVAKQYGIQSIPANFLLDPTGKIIAKNIRGEELKRKLAEVLDAKTLGMGK